MKEGMKQARGHRGAASVRLPPGNLMTYRRQLVIAMVPLRCSRSRRRCTFSMACDRLGQTIAPCLPCMAACGLPVSGARRPAAAGRFLLKSGPRS